MKQAYDKDGNKVDFAIYDDDYVVEIPDGNKVDFAIYDDDYVVEIPDGENKMKFSEIPQLTGEGNYEVNIFLEFLEKHIEDYKENYGLDLNPDFQRGHVWSEEQQISFVEFFLSGGVTGRIIYFNHPGWMTGFKGDFVIVDGKQRLNALLRFLKGEIKVFGYYIHEFEGKLRQARANMNLKFNINNLKTKKEVLKWYLEFNEGGTPHTEAELDKVRKMLEEEGN